MACKCDEFQSCPECHTVSLPGGWMADELAEPRLSITELQAALTKLKSERDALMEVVRPFAEYANNFQSWADKEAICWTTGHMGADVVDGKRKRLKVGDLRKARDVRNAIEADEGE